QMFKTKMANGILPSNVTLTITIEKDKDNKFRNHVDKLLASFNKKYEDVEEEDKIIPLQYVAVKPPKEVMSVDESQNLVSFLYTLFNGSYTSQNATDDSDDKTYTYLRSVNLKKNRILVETSGYSSSAEILKELIDSENTLATLNGFKHKTLYTQNESYHDSPTKFANDLKESFDLYTEDKTKYQDKLVSTPASRIAEMSSKESIVVINMNSKTAENVIGSMVTYMKTRGEK
ncbi:MAG: hypothetical protein HUJ76_12940, partial [Parasporobacterium sp.]|nr:hypothetical protein [Parasporobacterium sp.]